MGLKSHRGPMQGGKKKQELPPYLPFCPPGLGCQLSQCPITCLHSSSSLPLSIETQVKTPIAQMIRHAPWGYIALAHVVHVYNAELCILVAGHGNQTKRTLMGSQRTHFGKTATEECCLCDFVFPKQSCFLQFLVISSILSIWYSIGQGGLMLGDAKVREQLVRIP